MPYLRGRVNRLVRMSGMKLPRLFIVDCPERCEDCQYLTMTDEELREWTAPTVYQLTMDMRGAHVNDPKPCPGRRRAAALRGEGR